MLMLSEEELDWLAGRIPDAERSAKGGRPPADKRGVIAGIFWMLDNGAKWKDLPARFGPKSTVHRWFLKWVKTGVFESLMQAAGRCVEGAGGVRLYECFIDGTFSKAKSGGDGIGCTRVGKGVKIMILVDAKGLPVAACSAPAILRFCVIASVEFDVAWTPGALGVIRGSQSSRPAIFTMRWRRKPGL